MFLKIYQKFIIKEFLIITLKTTFVFLSLIIIMSVFDELSFFSQLNAS